MSTSITTTVTCDECGIREHIPSDDPAFVAARLARADWTERDGRDLCPSCEELLAGMPDGNALLDALLADAVAGRLTPDTTES